METRNVIIIGSGPAGLTAALYAARAGFKPLVIGGYVYGGQLMNTTVIENFPGFPEGIDGPLLMQNFIKQAQHFGAEVKNIDATGVDFTATKKIVKTAEGEFMADTIILATGATPKRLGIPGEDEYYGRGVSTCATCDGALYRGKIVAVIGGGDSAMEEATFLTEHATKVYIVHRRSELRASKIMADRALANPKIEVLWNSDTKEVKATGNRVSHLALVNNQTNEERDLEVDGVFLAIGHTPVTKFLGGQVKLTETGYIDSADGVHTSVGGVFVAGDVEDQIYRQAITAAGAGCRAALEAQRYLLHLPEDQEE
jgi:thioredoxin reductase (NADPH)